ncbi:MAG: hypothetical protein QNJ11_15260 [Woeseiaceae bacterium]|nr:hypothetical protein [Woeseiaceae bacterium]
MKRFVIIALVLCAACSAPPNHIATVKDFESLKNAGQDDATLELFAETASLHFGPLGSLTGIEQIREIHGYDLALRTQLRFDDCEQTDQVVSCRVLETNDWLRTAGIESIAYDETRFEFDVDGRIASVSATLSAESLQKMGAAMAAFDSWARANSAEEYAELFTDEGAFVYSYVNGEKVLSILRQWQAALESGE